MRRVYYVALLATVALVTWPLVVVAGDDWQKLYEVKTYENAKGQTIPYRLLTPATIEPGKRYPLVLFLHGLGERGTDNAAQLKHGAGRIRHGGESAEVSLLCRGPAMPGR